MIAEAERIRRILVDDNERGLDEDELSAILAELERADRLDAALTDLAAEFESAARALAQAKEQATGKAARAKFRNGHSDPTPNDGP